MAVTFNGYLFRGLSWVERTLFLIGGLILIYPHWASDLVGYGLLAVLVAWQLPALKARRAERLVAGGGVKP